MKKMIIFAVLLVIASTCAAQKGPVLPYKNNRTKSEWRDYVLHSSSDTAVECRRVLNEKLSQLLKDTLNYQSVHLERALTECLYEGTITLGPGDWENSAWDAGAKKIIFTPGQAYNGIFFRFRCGTYELSLAKKNCGNIPSISWEQRVSRPQVSQPVAPTITIQATEWENPRSGYGGVYDQGSHLIQWENPRSGYGGVYRQ